MSLWSLLRSLLDLELISLLGICTFTTATSYEKISFLFLEILKQNFCFFVILKLFRKTKF